MITFGVEEHWLPVFLVFGVAGGLAGGLVGWKCYGSWARAAGGILCVSCLVKAMAGWMKWNSLECLRARVKCLEVIETTLAVVEQANKTLYQKWGIKSSLEPSFD